MRLLHDNKIDDATLTALSQSLSFPIENLQDSRLSRKWRSKNDDVLAVDEGEHDVFQATSNLITDPENLTTGNWTEVNATASLSDEYYTDEDGNTYRFTKVLASAGDGRVFQDIVFTGDAAKGITVLVRKGDDPTSTIWLRDTDAGATRLDIDITWATQTITEVTGSAHIIEWKDTETVMLRCICTAVTAINENRLRLMSPTNGKYTYYTTIQAEDIVYPTPYTATTRAVTHPDVAYTMPSKFTFDIIFKPWFIHDTAGQPRQLSWYIDADHRLYLYWSSGGHYFSLVWKDGTNARTLISQDFDDGTADVDINQRIRIIASIDLITGNTTGSRFIVIPLESGAIAEDTVWAAGAIDAHTSTFPTLSIGHGNDVNQADSEIEYLRIYEGLLTGVINNSENATERLAQIGMTGDTDQSVLVDAGADMLEVFQATTNLVQDPEDLTTGNWTPVSAIAELSDFYYDGKRFTKIALSAASGYMSQLVSFTGNASKSIQLTLKKGDDSIEVILIRDASDGNAVKLEIVITWATKFIQTTTGILQNYKWIDDETVWIAGITISLIAANNNILWIRGTTDGKYFYATAVQAENLLYPTPYVDGSRATAHPDETFEMPSKFTIDMIVKLWGIYDTTVTSYRIIVFYLDGTRFFRILYERSSDTINIAWKDGGTERSMASQRFDHGDFYTNINQWIRIIGSIDLTTGTSIGSRLIVIPLESGDKYEDPDSWNGNIDAHTSNFPTLSIGHENDIYQADNQFEYVRIYAGTLVGTVGDSDDADALLAEMELSLDLTYQTKIKASYALIAGHNLTPGATVKLLGNNYDAWNGTPFEETFDWSEATMLKAFTEVEYPFWKLTIDDPNNPDTIIKIGRPYLGTFYQVLETFEKNFVEDPFNTDVPVYSKSGQLYSRRGYDGKAYKLSFPYWEDTVKKAVEDIVAVVGKRKPFFLILDEDNLSILPVLYCHIPEDPQYPHIIDYNWQASLAFREVK